VNSAVDYSSSLDFKPSLLSLPRMCLTASPCAIDACAAMNQHRLRETLVRHPNLLKVDSREGRTVVVLGRHMLHGEPGNAIESDEATRDLGVERKLVVGE